VPNLDWNLFGYDTSTSKLNLPDDGTQVVGTLISESETVQTVKCSLVPDPAGKMAGDKIVPSKTRGLESESKEILDLVEASGATGIRCDTKGKKPQSILIRAAKGTDVKGLLVEADPEYSYGTDEIKEIYDGENFFIEWGEEGNYVLAIPNMAFNLFGYQK